MPGPSPRLWSSFSAAAYRSLLLNTVDDIRGAFLAGPQTREAFRQASVSESWPAAFSSLITRILSSAREKAPSSCRGLRGTSERGRWRAQRTSSSGMPSGSASALSCQSFYYPNSASATIWSLFLSRRFASSTSFTARFPSRGRQQGKVNNVRSGAHVKSKRTAAPAKKGRPGFRGALSSIKHLQFERGRGLSRPSSAQGDARKRHGTSSGISFSKPGQAVLSPPRKNSSDTARFIKFKDRPTDEGLKVKRKRKRIRPRPRDVTYKRGLDSNVINVASETEQKPPSVEGKPSLNAQFRQIQPSRELLAHIEENYLGRRRLAEWRKGGYDPKRTAPLDDLPDGKTKRNPIQETVFKHKLTFIAAAKQIASLPPLEYPEVAFAGRSNVGKSSLINALSRRWGVARTSEKPGLTQSINFFTFGSQLCLVDLPGYGFAYAKEEKKEEWEELVKYYVQTRANLKRVCVLVDAKWGLKPRDEELLHLMESAGTRFQIVVTKTDILPPVDLARRATQILQVLENHRCLVRPLVMVSSKTGAGLQLFRASLASIAPSQSRFLQEDNL